MSLGTLISNLKVRKQILEAIEKEKKQAFSALAIVPVDGSDRFSRAATAIERRFYRALAMLMTVQAKANFIPSLPGPPK